jgi:hypothetical protein
MAIIGGKFKDYVEKQIQQRQKILGGNILTRTTLQSINTKTPWIRMASSVNITQGDSSLPGKSVYDQVGDVFNGIDWKDDNLAKNFVLFNGVNDSVGGTNKMPTSNTGTPLQKAYGFGYNNLGTQNSRGPVPLPGIQSVDFSYKNDGALAQASVKVKCFSPEQFQMIDILFQRPGYTVLLEFGHTSFKDNEGNLQYAGEGDYSYSTAPFINLFKTNGDNASFYTLHDIISQEKQKWNGNYEAFYAKISKFNWSFNQDGSYDVTVNLVGMGDVISSLKMNVIPPKVNFEFSVSNSRTVANANPENLISLTLKQYKDSKSEAIENLSEGSLVGSKGYTTKDYVFFYVKKGSEIKYYKISKSSYSTAAFTVGDSDTVQNSLTSPFNLELRRIYDRIKKEQDTSNDATKGYYPPGYPRLRIGEGENGEVTSFKVGGIPGVPDGILAINRKKKEEDGNTSDYPGIYINFISFLSILQQHSNLYSGDVPLITYDFDFEAPQEDNNYIKIYPGLFSSDPTKILIPYKQLPTNIVGDSKPLSRRDKSQNGGKHWSQTLSESGQFFVEGDPNKGRLAYVYLNIDYLSSKYKEAIGGKDSTVLTIKFLKDVLDDINSNLGNLNEFKVLHNKDTNTIQIASETPINTTLPNLTRVNTFGVTKTEGSFVKNISLDSELSDNFSTLISVGAQRNGNTSQSNSTAFSTYNKGLIDRMIPIKDSTGNIKTTTDVTPSGSTESDNNIISTWGDIWTDKSSTIFKSVYEEDNFDSETLSSLKDLNKNISDFITGELTNKSLAPLPFFLPFNLKLTLDGLSGMQIYNSFEIDGKVLPLTYKPGEIELIIKGLSHTVDDNGWVTKIETFSRPKFKYNPSKIKQLETPPFRKEIYKDPPIYLQSTSNSFTPSKDRGTISFNSTSAFKLFKSRGNKTKFENSLKQVLLYMQSDPNLKSIDHASYLLATAAAESDYSLERWEADYVCKGAGISYLTFPEKKPCSKAINYYRSSKGKKNYFKSGTDSRGLPYFGRGLIQLTHKYNYEKYGKILGIDLVNNADLAMVPLNSYNIASTYMNLKTFRFIDKGDLKGARKSVNGGTKGVDDVNRAFEEWKAILSDPSVEFKVTELLILA